jgi:hypothetical protein
MFNPSSTRPLLAGQRCQCTACGERFRSSFAFDRHRLGTYGTVREPGTRRCLTPAEMEARGMVRGASGLWVSSARPIEAQPAALAT